MSAPGTARSRVPNTGRSNISACSSSSRSQSSINIPTARRIELNDPLQVFRPFSPENKIMDAHIKRPPILSKSRYSTLPPEEPELRRTRPLTCPEEWVEKLNAQDFFETADFKTLVDENAKNTFCREFVERNRNRLWKFNLKYLNRSPQEVCFDIVDNPGYMGTMKAYLSKERVLNLNSSEKFRASIKDDHLNSLGEVKDAYSTSLTTSRTSRETKLRNLIDGSLQNREAKFNRGYNHAPEYGNFSKFSGIMLLNEGATLKR